MVLGSIQGENGYTDQPIKVGIGTANPQTRLEVKDVIALSGYSGLRLTSLAGDAPLSTTVNGVLSVNPANGDVILVNGSGGSGNTTMCSTTFPDNYLTKKTAANTICKSIVYDDYTNVGISTTNPFYKLDVNGDIRCTKNLYISTDNVTGGGIRLSDDGDIVDLNDGWATHRFSYGLRLTNSSLGGNTVIQLANGNSGYTYFNSGYVGIGTTTPNNGLEISTATPGTGGLRLTSLQGASPVSIPVNGVLSVNPSNGDVILVNGGGTLNNANNGTSISALNSNTVVLGQSLAQIGNPGQLLSDREIPMSDNNLVFTMPVNPDPLKNRVGFGTSTPDAEVEINSTIGSYNFNTLPIVSNSGTYGAGWQFIGGGNNPKDWVLHATGPSNYQLAGKFIFHVDSTDIMTMVAPSLPQMSNPDGKIGIQTNAPVRTLEVFKYDEPQLRLTASINPAIPAYTDFQTTTGGNLRINSDDGHSTSSKRVGINLNYGLEPGNTLEINSSYGSPTQSGLRFTNLTSASSPVTTPPTTNVLSVNADGDVILIAATGGTGTLGGECNLSPQGLAYNWEIPLSTHNYIFSGQGMTQQITVPYLPATINTVLGGNNCVGIGTDCEPIAKLDVLENTGQVGYSTIAVNVHNIDICSTSSSSGMPIIGINSTVDNTEIYGDKSHVAGLFSASGAQSNYGGYFSVSSPNGYNYGIYSNVKGGYNNCSGRFNSIGTSGTNYGIYASAHNGSTNYAGYFDGDVYINNGTFSANGYVSGSDSMLKTNISSIQNALSLINQLKPKSFYFDTTNVYNIRFSSNKQYGLVAQDVQSVLPELVYNTHKPAEYDSLGNVIASSVDYKSLNYQAFTSILIQGVKELNTKNDSLTQTVDSLKNIITSYESRFTSIENMLSQCCTQQSRLMQTDVNATIQISSDPSMKQTQLYQNRPNPFNAKTTFAYTLGEGGNVELIIEDSYGRLVTTLVSQNQTPGEYSVDWNAENITSGIYFYSLKVNGIVLVKKAIKF